MGLALRWAIGFTILWWLWMLLVGEWNRDEWIAATAAAAVGATLLEVARSRSGVELRVLARAASVPVAIVVDFGIVTRALVSGVARGRLPYIAVGTAVLGGVWMLALR